MEKKACSRGNLWSRRAVRTCIIGITKNKDYSYSCELFYPYSWSIPEMDQHIVDQAGHLCSLMLDEESYYEVQLLIRINEILPYKISSGNVFELLMNTPDSARFAVLNFYKRSYVITIISPLFTCHFL